jgi:hypothetical protein
MAPLHGGSSAGKSDLCCGRSLNVVGHPGSHQSSLMSTCLADCPSPGPQKNDLANYWALGPFVRSFTLPVDPGDICPPHEPLRIQHISDEVLTKRARGKLHQLQQLRVQRCRVPPRRSLKRGGGHQTTRRRPHAHGRMLEAVEARPRQKNSSHKSRPRNMIHSISQMESSNCFTMYK